MNPPRSQLDRFVSALHRRLVLVRALETAALGAAGGCAVGAALIPLLYWRDIPALPPTLGAMLLGAAAGLLWGLAHAPTKLHAAAEADRQLGLADLLGTALSVGPRPRESDRDDAEQPWLRTVASLADAACRSHVPSQVILHRLQPRAWGGVAVAAALVLSVAALTTPEPTARAAASSGAARRVGAPAAPDEVAGADGGANQPAVSRSQGLGPERERDREAASRATTGTPDDTGTGDAGPDGAGDSTATSDAGQGGGTARAKTPPANPTLPPPGAARRTSPSEVGDPTGGTAPAATRPTTGADSPGTAGGASPPAPPAPAWHSPTWPDDTRRAREAIDSGRVPDARRDLVREYFERR